jgi:hypothetical protein
LGEATSDATGRREFGVLSMARVFYFSPSISPTHAY